ncbi:alpha-2-macroglobulin family protein [Flavobacterium sp. GNP001]
MRGILLFLFFTCTVMQSQQFDKKWQEVLANENQGKIKSASVLVDRIYKKAVQNKNEEQIIKCFFYKSKYLQVLEEDAKSQIIHNLKTEIKTASIPTKAILNLVYAKCLSDYNEEYENFGVAVVDSSSLENENNENIIDSATVSNYKTSEDIVKIFEKTLENESVLKVIPLTNYEEVFNFLTLEKLKKENLFEYLLKENITFFQTKINEWQFDAKQFEAYKNNLLGNSDAFLKLNIDFIGDESLKKVLSLFQKLEADAPTIENKLERILFCSNYLIKSDENLLTALVNLETLPSEDIILQKIQLEKAKTYANLASKEVHPDYNNKALAELESVLKTNDNSNTFKLAQQAKEELLSKTIQVELQQNIYNKENTRAFIRYRNTNNLKVSFFKISNNKKEEFYQKYQKSDSLANYIVANKKPFVTKSYELIDKKDYFEYTTEVLLPQLETGNYLVYFESDSNSKEKKGFGFETITVSNISVLANTKDNTEYHTVIDRKTGTPLENVTIKLLNKTLKTDKNGLAFHPKEKDNYANSYIQFSTKNDTLLIQKEYLNNSYDYKKIEDKKIVRKVEFYLDRAIYRPGQTVYFKGIAIQKKNNKSNVVPNSSFLISIQDPNYNNFKDIEVSTNEFGSFSGEFILPKTGLTGSFRIQAKHPAAYTKNMSSDITGDEQPMLENVTLENSSTYFRVEEYKRPKFQVTFEPKKESFQVNQLVTVKGTAKAFAGSTISDAKVTYTITRFTNSYRNYYSNEPDETLISSETKTDASGKFVIDFIAKPSYNASKEQQPIFNYRINASVTDINGETHTAVTTIKVGYHDLVLNAFIANRIETKNKNEINVNSTNLNGEFKATKGVIKLYYVSPFENKFKSRVFTKPEIATISDTDFEKLFPYEVNQSETSKKPTEILLFSKKIDTEKDKNIALDFITDYQSGNYKIVFSAKDSFENPIETVSNFSIIQSKDKYNPNKLFTIEQINKDPKKDGFVTVEIRSILNSLHILTSANYKNGTFYEQNIVLENKRATVTIPLQKDFEKSLKIGFQSVFENQAFTEQLEVALKSEEHKIEFSVESFRNKIQPGTTENWSFHIKSSNTLQEAEILASMYDSSLDQFSKTSWEALNFNDFSRNNIYFKTGLGFENTYIYFQNLNLDSNPLNLLNEVIRLKWFGFNFNESTYGNGPSYYEIKDKKLGSEIIKGDPDAVLTVEPRVTGTAAALQEVVYAPSPKVDQLQFVKPTIAKSDKIIIRGAASSSAPLNALCIVDGVPMSMEQIKAIPSADILNIEVLNGTKATALYGEKGKNGVIIITTKKALEAITQVKARTNLSETAFFYPHLQSDAKGKVQFSFTSPEALTAWKLRLMAHNKEAVSGFLEKTVVTQKELMVTPNLPRFFREKDSITITAKIANITKDPKVGIAIFQLYDATNMQPIDLKMANNKPTKNFTIAPFGNTTVSWKIYIPEGLQGVQYKILAKAGDFSDGEENIIPVLTNNMLVTESIPVWVKDNSKKEYTFTNLKNNSSSTLKNHQFTFEYTSNPTWLAIQSLPYLMEYEHECTEQTFARFYANALATNIINSNPKIEQVFDNWRQKGTKNSPLESNETLKSIILAETPWLRDVSSEEEKKQRLATLFDLEKMKASQEATFDKLKQKQKSSGGFAWFDGSDANEYITRHIVAGLGHLQKLSSDEKTTASISTITKTAVPYLDQQFLLSHNNSTANNSTLIWRNPYTELHYLYSRSFFLKTNPTSDTLTKTINKYLDAVKKDWLTYSLYQKGLAALTLNRFGEQESAKKIIESLKETASNNEDWGMYWIANKSGWYWYQAPIETQALLIEAFTEVTNDKKSVDDMKVWLLKNKQTKNWPTTKSTTEAIYALLMQGTDWLSVKDNTVIKIGDEKILTKKRTETDKESETGYLKLTWKAAEIKKEMATVSIQNKSNVPGYGGIYWQYFEDLDQIKTSDNQNLTILKELYLNKDTANGKQLNKITAANPLQIGDLVTVRIVINAKEPMEFVHLKDMRASCFEPTDVLSTYQYKGGLGFYQSTKDAATHFFFDKIEKGTYVLEYTVRVNNKGDFSNGISTIQSMYAPEYSSHTKGIRVTVKE